MCVNCFSEATEQRHIGHPVADEHLLRNVIPIGAKEATQIPRDCFSSNKFLMPVETDKGEDRTLRNFKKGYVIFLVAHI